MLSLVPGAVTTVTAVTEEVKGESATAFRRCTPSVTESWTVPEVWGTT